MRAAFRNKDLSRTAREGSDAVRRFIEDNPSRSRLLFRRGYVITTQSFELSGHPFYENWTTESLGTLSGGLALDLYTHSDTPSHKKIYDNNRTFAIIGHAYDPVAGLADEGSILDALASAFEVSEEEFFYRLGDLTGIHLVVVNDNGRLIVIQDCAGMRSCYYFHSGAHVMLTSHPQLAGDLLDLRADKHASDLMSRWFFSLTGKSLPGDLSPFEGLRRLGPNLALIFDGEFHLHRFFPVTPRLVVNDGNSESTIQRLVELITANIELCAQKWERPAISLSGGLDSRTTLACASPHLSKFTAFSFHSKPPEAVDAEVAADLSILMGISHRIYSIPDTDESVQDFNAIRAILSHNASYVWQPKDNEIRKFATLSQVEDFDVELKSWISEVGRVHHEKQIGLELSGQLTPRQFNILATRYVGAPVLLRRSDRIQKEFLRRSDLLIPSHNYDHLDLYSWEMYLGSWGSNAKTVQDIFGYEVTMPMNNRRILELLLSFPREARKNDEVHHAILEVANPKLAKIPMVKNLYSSNRRVFY